MAAKGRIANGAHFHDINTCSSVVLVMAHPDDIKCVTGYVIRALARKACVSLVLLTRGEGHVSRARPNAAPRKMGRIRMAELRKFLGALCIPRGNFFVMGIPDGGNALTAMREDFFKPVGDPFSDPFLHIDSVCYRDAYMPAMPFFGELLLGALKKLFIKLQPDIILTHHPKDDHMDHRAASFFTRLACKQLHVKRRLKHNPPIYAPLVYYKRHIWPPKGNSFCTKEAGNMFPGFKEKCFPLSDTEFLQKKKACMAFVPTLSKAYIGSYMKRDELLWRI